jgi:hypothetical protein
LVDNRIDIIARHPLGAQNLGQELAFAGYVGIDIITTGVCQVLFEARIRRNRLWVLTQIVTHEQMVADARGGVMPEVEVVAGEVYRCRKRLAPGNPQIAPMLVTKRDERSDYRRDIRFVLHHNVHINHWFRS